MPIRSLMWSSAMALTRCFTVWSPTACTDGSPHGNRHLPYSNVCFMCFKTTRNLQKLCSHCSGTVHLCHPRTRSNHQSNIGTTSLSSSSVPFQLGTAMWPVISRHNSRVTMRKASPSGAQCRRPPCSRVINGASEAVEDFRAFLSLRSAFLRREVALYSTQYPEQIVYPFSSECFGDTASSRVRSVCSHYHTKCNTTGLCQFWSSSNGA